MKAKLIMIELVTRQDLKSAVETQALRLTIRLGVMVFLAFGALAAILKLT